MEKKKGLALKVSAHALACRIMCRTEPPSATLQLNWASLSVVVMKPSTFNPLKRRQFYLLQLFLIEL